MIVSSSIQADIEEALLRRKKQELLEMYAIGKRGNFLDTHISCSPQKLFQMVMIWTSSPQQRKSRRWTPLLTSLPR